MSNFFTLNTPQDKDDLIFRAMHEGLEARLRAAGHENAQSFEDAEVLLYCHRYPEIEIAASDVAALPFPPSVRLVLLLRPLRSARLADRNRDVPAGRSGPRVLSVDPAPAPDLAKRVDEAMNSVASSPPLSFFGPAHRSLTTGHFAALLRSSVGLEFTELTNLLSPAPLPSCLKYKGLSASTSLLDHLVALFAQYFGTGDVLSLREALLLLTRDDSAARHNLRGRMDRPFETADQDFVGERWSARRLLEFFADLRESLLAPVSRPKDPSILIFDDHTGPELKQNLDDVRRAFLGNGMVQFEDPTIRSGGEDSILSYFAGYQTLGARPAPSALSELLKKCGAKRPDFILVDQFFRSPGSEHGSVLGPEMIRGLIRWMHDTRSTSFRNAERLPEVIALSRTDDPAVIQAAMRAGARDYVLKSRLVALPAILARVARGTGDPVSSLHRNFRTLYELPNETIGLLQAARIPRVAFHDLAVTSEKGSEEWSKLLTLLPKADLHVHAGSVMSRDFLTLASAVMLARHPVRGKGPSFESAFSLAQVFNNILDSRSVPSITARNGVPFGGPEVEAGEWPKDHPSPGEWFVAWSRNAKHRLARRLRAGKLSDFEFRQFRATLHSALGVPDYASGGEAARHLTAKNDLEVTLFLIRHASKLDWPTDDPSKPVSSSIDASGWHNEDLIRLYLLVLASRYSEGGSPTASLRLSRTRRKRSDGGVDLLRAFRVGASPIGKDESDAWLCLSRLHGPPAERLSGKDPWYGSSCASFRRRGWSTPESFPPIRVTVPVPERRPEERTSLAFDKDPIGFTLATGTRCTNLADYLLGCEFSGAEHLRHPFLIHVYARQAVMGFIRQGVFYAELKASPDGYVNREIGFEYDGVVQCLAQAFSEAQSEVLRVHRGDPLVGSGADGSVWAGQVLASLGSDDGLAARLSSPPDGPDAGFFERPAEHAPWLPCKVSLVFVGKRHKALREMILEAAGAAVMRPAGERPAASASAFVTEEFRRCRVVGFDLAGQEVGHPPSEYAPEFGRLSRLHVPITVHAGENAPPQYIEDAILDLGAVRIGHGLSLAEDRRLMARLRDDRIAVELCPVCNHQTSQFHRPGPGGRRPYPLQDFFRAGINVTINTDNPIISDTSMVREFYQASWAWDDRPNVKTPEGMPLWEALRIIRMGFVSSFLNLSERRHMLELVGQYLFDLFSDESVVRQLRLFVEDPPTR